MDEREVRIENLKQEVLVWKDLTPTKTINQIEKIY